MKIKLKILGSMALLMALMQSCDKNEPDSIYINGNPKVQGHTFQVKEDISDNTVIGVVEATDPDEDPLVYSIKKDESNLFEITKNGELSLIKGKSLDYESETEHMLVAYVYDGIMGIDIEVLVKVENVPEAIAEDPAAFVTTWKTETDNQTIYLGANENYDYDFTIDWGDGTVENIIENTPEYFDHTYTTAGTYKVSIIGDFPSIYMFKIYDLYGEEQNLMLASIERWGDIEWKSLLGAFSNCSQMKYNATDVPNLESTISTAAMFLNTDFNADLNDWKTGNVTGMSYMFAETDTFNGDISDWDTSKVTNMYAMFSEATAFNSDLSDWDVSNVENMHSMFGAATSFNADLSNWKTLSLVDMGSMFEGAVSFNQDLSNWETGKVTDMESMFNNAKLFNQDLSGWNIGKVETMANMFNNSGMSKENLNATLIGWSNYVDANNGPDNITLGLDNLLICGPDVFAAVTVLNQNGWGFFGDVNYANECP